MASPALQTRAASVATRLSLLVLIMVSIVFFVFAAALYRGMVTSLEREATQRMQVEARGIVSMVRMYSATVQTEAGRFMDVFAADYGSRFSVDNAQQIKVGEQLTPVLRANDEILNLNFTLPDRFTERTSGVATIFVKRGSDFVRVSTSLKDANGQRAMGTLLAPDSAAYAQLSKGQSFSGPATLFGTFYMTVYRPIQDASGQVVGALFVGVNIGATTDALKRDVEARKIGDTGSYFVVSGAAGQDRGAYLTPVARANRSATSGADAIVDDRGAALIPAMLEQRLGVLRTQQQGDERLFAYDYAPEWQWLVVGNASMSELTAEMRQTRLIYAGAALLALMVLAAVLFALVRQLVGKRLNAVMAVAQKLAQGDLRARADVGRPDEIGRLTQAVNGIGDGLIGIVGRVRVAAGEIGGQTQAIAASSANISEQTESQAANVEETMASLEQLTATVQQNAGNVDLADARVVEVAAAADRGATMVDTLVQSMDGVSAASTKMSDAIAVINSIAFQTNILALNAAVEAARAGSEGRGFAVVAAEVRQLAQRSAEAAKSIEALIRASIERVGEGHAQAAQTRAAIGTIAQQMRDVATLVADISTATREQSAGVGQINEAVIHIGTMTQRNAALADEAAGVGRNLDALALQLDDSVRAFQLA
ncbi:Cache 3/Cache 2 fusion domain-containing protein [Alcaligenaceae bacterium C4P045]|nr:Cache 3/Cache 2 fusion domain-containing protein [Alcaligenaceae bacterium C4P045]